VTIGLNFCLSTKNLVDDVSENIFNDLIGYGTLGA
jgi:hypothetical protein